MAKQLSMISRSVWDRMLDEWEALPAPMSIHGFVDSLSPDFLELEEKDGLVKNALCEGLRKRLRRPNPKTQLPFGAETPLFDDDGRPIWKQPEGMTYDEAAWNLERNINRIKTDLAKAREWYLWMMKRWPGQLQAKFPLLVQAFDGDDSAVHELSRLTM